MDKQAFDLLMKRFDSLDDGIADLKETSKGHNNRISSLEDTRSNQRGIMIGGGTVVTFLSGFISWFVKHSGG